MSNQYKNNPVWKEIPLVTATEDDLEDLSSKYELLLDPRKFSIFFFGNTTTLNAQEYKFLKAILTKKGERVSANKLMSQIKSNCKLERRQELSYRIKSKIKVKLKHIAPIEIPIENNNWILLEQKATISKNVIYDIAGKPLHFQKFDFERNFENLISVKDGYYFTYYRPA